MRGVCESTARRPAAPLSPRARGREQHARGARGPPRARRAARRWRASRGPARWRALPRAARRRPPPGGSMLGRRRAWGVAGVCFARFAWGITARLQRAAARRVVAQPHAVTQAEAHLRRARRTVSGGERTVCRRGGRRCALTAAAATCSGARGLSWRPSHSHGWPSQPGLAEARSRGAGCCAAEERTRGRHTCTRRSRISSPHAVGCRVVRVRWSAPCWPLARRPRRPLMRLPHCSCRSGLPV